MGLILIDSDLGQELGFTSDRFDTRSYLFLDNDQLYVSHIHSTEMNKGYFGSLVRAIWQRGWALKVPSPYQRMEKILRHYGARPTIEFDSKMGPCEVWVALPPEDGSLQSNTT